MVWFVNSWKKFVKQPHNAREVEKNKFSYLQPSFNSNKYNFDISICIRVWTSWKIKRSYEFLISKIIID